MSALLDPGRLDALLAAAATLRIGVLGDFALDAYWTVDMRQSELSRETPLPNRPVVEESLGPGGAAHVARSIRRLGPEVSAHTVIGKDWRGDLLAEQLTRAGIADRGVVRSAGFNTVLFAKVVLTAENRRQEDARLDFVNQQPPPPAEQRAMLDELAAALGTLDALVVSDYQQCGVVTPGVSTWLREVRAQNPTLLVLADSRERIGDYADTVCTPNRQELAAYLEDPADDCVDALLKTLSAQRTTDIPWFVTLDVHGCAVVTSDAVDVIPTVRIDGGDPVGAGDAFLAGLATALAAGAAPREAACFANLAAAATVTQVGTTGEPDAELMRSLNVRT